MKEYILRKARSSCSLDIIHKGVRVRLLFADGNALSGIPPRLYTDDEFKQEAIESSKYFADGVIVAAHEGGGDSGPTFAIKGSSVDNVEIAAGARKNSEIQIVGSNENFMIVGLKRCFISNATAGGANRDYVVLQSLSTGGGGKNAQIAVRNTGSETAKIKIEVEYLCMSVSN